ncbi:MAG TPA: hypothetical protein VIY48_01800, partial [Candidatus Paceibacterota bacterium]
AVIALASAVVVGTVTALLSGSFSGVNWVAAIGIVFAVSQTAYHFWWKNSDISKFIEQKFNIVPDNTIEGQVVSSTTTVVEKEKV